MGQSDIGREEIRRHLANNILPSLLAHADMHAADALVYNAALREKGSEHDPTSYALYHWHRHLSDVLAPVAAMYASIPASSIPVERSFSRTGRIHTKSRYSLLPSNIEDAVYVASHMPSPKELPGFLNLLRTTATALYNDLLDEAVRPEPDDAENDVIVVGSASVVK